MKVILNKDLATLGEEGDVKDVARGFARNYLFPRGIALPFNPRMIKLIESRKGEIEARKEQKRLDARGLKEKLEALEISIAMHAGANGRLYGAVTNQTIADELAKNGHQIERKRIDIGGSGFKTTGKHKAIIRLYENQSSEISVVITALEIKTEAAPSKPARRSRKDEASESASVETGAAQEAQNTSDE